MAELLLCNKGPSLAMDAWSLLSKVEELLDGPLKDSGEKEGIEKEGVGTPSIQRKQGKNTGLEKRQRFEIDFETYGWNPIA